jgi:hypothetical protein
LCIFLEQFCQLKRLELDPKPHLRSNSCVANLFEMLTYYRVCFAFSSACALLLNLIWGFETTSGVVSHK